MKNKWPKILFWFFAVLPFLLSAGFYSRMPATVATHFDASGAPNGYTTRAEAAFGLPAFYLGITLLVFFLLKIDPKKDNIERSPQLRAVALWGIVLIGDLCQAAILLRAVNIRLNISAFVGVAVGLLFVGIGNYLPKCKPNYTMGIRLPWTLASEENWRKTHRFAGPLWVAGGILIALSSFLTSAQVFIILAATLALSVVPAVYSYLLFRRESGNKP